MANRKPVLVIKITVHDDNALSIEGPVEQKEYMLAVLANAADAVRNHHSRKPIVIPGKDVSIE